MVIGISTAWKSSGWIRGAALVEELISLGIDGLELDYRIPSALFLDMKTALKKTRIFSVHNYFPVPELLLPSQGSGDAFLLTAGDEERNLAIEFTKKSLQVVGELGADKLVVHLGEVAGMNGSRGIIKKYQAEWEEGEFEAMVREFKAERAKRSKQVMNRLYDSLEKVLAEAERLGVFVCMENRYYPHQIPSHEEVGEILGRFSGAPIKYWHDVGHAVVQERLGFTPHLDWLKSYGDALAGVHFHDVVDLHDHRAPGMGGVSFEELRSYLNDGVVKIVEVHPFVRREELLDGMERLRRALSG